MRGTDVPAYSTVRGHGECGIVGLWDYEIMEMGNASGQSTLGIVAAGLLAAAMLDLAGKCCNVNVVWQVSYHFR